MLGAVSVLAALLGRAGTSGAGAPDVAGDAVAAGGQRIDISLLGATLASLVNQAQNAFVTGVPPARLGNAHPNIVPYETFDAADGPIAVAVGSERQWRKLWQVLDLPEIATDQRFATNGGRVEHRAELRPLLAARFLERDRTTWLAALELRGIPSGPIRDIVEAFASPEAAALGMTVEQEHPAWGVIRQAGIPFRLSRTPAAIRTPPPLLGQHTDEVLSALGRTPAQIEALRRGGVV
jgi:formyl-CoA transferase